MRLTRWVGLVAVLGASAWADTFEMFGYGPRGAAMAGAMTAEANDFTGVFYNPATLVNRKEANFGFAMQYHKPIATVVPKDLAQTLDCSKCQAPETTGTGVGFLFPLGGKVKNRVAIGVGVYLPANKLLTLSAPKATAPYWLRYNSNTDRLGIHLGVSIKITDWLNIGLGGQGLANLVGDGAAVKVDLFSKQIKSGEITSVLTNSLGPIAGIQLTPWKRLRVGATFRGSIQLLTLIPAAVDLEGIGAIVLNIKAIGHYSPHTVQFGAAFDITDDLTVALDGEWENWSAAPSPYLTLDMALSGATLAALGLDQAFNISSPNQPTGFTDTLTGRFGIEYRPSKRVEVRGGAFYRPTMVPLQNVVGTNLMDNTAIGVSAGVGLSFDDPTEVFANPLHIDIAAQGTFLLPREATKPVGETSPPSYVYSANVLGGMAALRYDF